MSNENTNTVDLYLAFRELREARAEGDDHAENQALGNLEALLPTPTFEQMAQRLASAESSLAFLDKEVAELRGAYTYAVEERDRLRDERDIAKVDLETARLVADRLQKEVDTLRGQSND